jgi:hypothetical protein
MNGLNVLKLIHGLMMTILEIEMVDSISFTN